MSEATSVIVLNETSFTAGKSGAGVMRNRCAFTSRDMGADWPEAFTYAVVFGWDDAMDEVAAEFGWDAPLVAFLVDAHERFKAVPDVTEIREGKTNG